MRFADYFGRAFSGVSAAQFPWVKLLRESPVAKIVDVSLGLCFVIFFWNLPCSGWILRSVYAYL